MKAPDRYERNPHEMENQVVETHAMALLANLAFSEVEEEMSAATFGERRYYLVPVPDWVAFKAAFEGFYDEVQKLEAVYFGPDLVTGGRYPLGEKTRLYAILHPDKA